MYKHVAVAAILSFSIHHGHCQEPAQAAAFEVSSITPCKPGTPEPVEQHMGLVKFVYPGGRFEARATSLKFLLEWAYGILPAQHSNGPSWTEYDRYDIVAKAGESATEDQIKLMTQTLLADRFKLKIHRETRDLPVVVISLGKTAPKLFPPKEGEKYSIRMDPRMGPDRKILAWHVSATRFSFAQLNEAFSRHLDRIILDHTGIKGDFDFSFDMTPDDNQPNPMDPAMIISAMRDQLGLNVKSQKEPVEFFVIDNAERVVAGN